MKRFCFTTLGMFAILAACTGPKKALDFQVCFKPGMLYKQTVIYQMHVVMSYSGSDNFMQTLKARGITNPMTKDTVEKHNSITRTGKMDGDKKFPLVMEADNFYAPSANSTPSNLYVYGSCEEGKIPSIDSISLSGMPQAVKDAMSQTFRNTFAQIILPEKSLNVGDTFTIVQPLNMPMGSAKMDMKMKVTYILKRLSKDSAWFNTQENYIFNMNVANVPIKAKGSGKGTYTYDIANNIYSNLQSTDTMNFDYTYPMFTMKMNAVMHQIFKEAVSPDK